MVIDTLQLDIIVNNKGTTARINSTTKALKNLHKVITDINGAGGVNGTINGGGGGSSSSGGSSRLGGARGAKNLGKNLNKVFNIGSIVSKLYFARNVTKQLGQDLAKVVQYGIDYEETLNLWQVAMKENISQARTFVSEMNKAYGISSATVMNYQATFKNMLSALDGISQDTAYGLSEALSQMALDYASLYNTSIESAMTKFQAVLAGQVRPIRSESGYDITEQTLFQLYQSLGGTKSVRQLDQMEKRLLRILAVYKQMQGTATGDLKKTIESSANQLRVMKEQIKEFATWIGVAGNTLLENSGILVTINAYLYAAVALAKQFAITLGYVEKDYTVSEPIEEANTALDDANKNVDELKNKLLGFDKFQVLSTAGVETGNVDLSAEITKAISEYESILGEAENPAFEKSLELLQQWGLELDENGNIVGGFEKVKEKATDIARTFGGIVILIGLITKPWMVLVGAIEYAYLTNEDFRKSINESLSILSGAGTTIFESLLDLCTAAVPILTEIVEGFAGIVDFLDELGLLDDTIALIVDALILWKAVNIVSEIQKFSQQIAPLINGLKKYVIQLQSTTTATKALYAASAVCAAIGLQLLLDGLGDLSNWGDMSGMEKLSTVLKIVAGAAFLAAAAFATLHTAWSMGAAAAAIAVGLTAILASLASAQAAAKEMQANVQMKADGGLATKGTLFYAGEAGPELVTQTSGGGSTIMNMKQLEDAVARGMIRGAAATQGSEGQQITVNVSGRSLFDILVSEAKSNGYELVKVR